MVGTIHNELLLDETVQPFANVENTRCKRDCNIFLELIPNAVTSAAIVASNVMRSKPITFSLCFANLSICKDCNTCEAFCLCE